MADVQKTIEYVVTTTDRSSANFAKIGLAAGAMGAAILGALAIAVKNGAEAQKAQLQLEHATLNVAKASQAELKALEATAAALQKKGVLDADAIKMGQAQLMTFGLSADMANKLSGSLADLAVNQFGVNASGQDLTNTANIMAKALNGQFGVLERSGIRFTELQKQMIQFGTEAERAAAMQEGLAQNLKFTNEVALQTFEGQLAKTKSLLGNMTEEIGMALIPVLITFLKTVQPILQKMIKWMQANPELVKTITMVTAGLGALLTVVGAATAAVLAVKVALVGLGITLAAGGALMLALGGLVTLIVVIIQHWEGLKWMIGNFVSATLELIKAWAGQVRDLFLLVWMLIQQAFDAGITAASNAWNAFLGALKGAVMAPIDAIRSAFQGLFDWIADRLGAVMDMAQRAVDTVRNIGAGISSAAKKVTGRATGGTIREPLTLVGERGPELISAPGYKVHTAQETRGMMGELPST
jgi:hypothetical protein